MNGAFLLKMKQQIFIKSNYKFLSSAGAACTTAFFYCRRAAATKYIDLENENTSILLSIF